MRFSSFFRKREKRSVGDPHYWPNLFGKLWGILTNTGISVSADNALESSAVYACVRVISESVASLPLQVFKRRPDGGKEVTPDHWLYPILHDSPNEWQTSFEHREMYMGHLNLRGNAYDFIERNGKGQILRLIPMNPKEMKVAVENGKIQYEYKHPDGKEKKYPQEVIWHKKGLSSDGYVGQSPISLAREAIGLSLATEKYGSKFFSQAAKPGGIFKHPGRLSEAAFKRLKEDLDKKTDMDQAWKNLILEEGLEWEKVGLDNKDSQFLETRTFQIEEIARIFRVPVVLLQRQDKSSTYASAEQFFLSFVVHTIRPWLVRLEQSMSKYLLTEQDRKAGYFCEHKVDGLLRGDIETRYKAYAVAIQNTWMNPNEVRRLENMNPREGGDIYENPNISPGGM